MEEECSHKVSETQNILESWAQKRRDYYQKNKERICNKEKLYYNKHKDTRLKTMKQYRDKKKSSASIKEKSVTSLDVTQGESK